MTPVTDIATLETLYGDPVPQSLTKVVSHITPHYAKWIGASRLVMVSTVGPDGTDCSPRGDVGPVVRLADTTTLLLPDWRGNNRIDTLRNIVTDGRISLLFMIPGVTTVVRVNGKAIVTVDPSAVEQFVQNGNHPRSVVAVTVRDVYFQCAKALMRSQIWTEGGGHNGVPTPGELLRERDATFDSDDYDTHYAERAEPKMW